MPDGGARPARVAVVLRVLKVLEARERTVLVTATAAIVLVGLIDHATGSFASPNVFYVFPVAAGAAGSGRRVGFALLGLATVVAFMAAITDPTTPSGMVMVWNLSARIVFLSLLIVAIDALRHAIASLERLATTDPLTGALNRRSFYAAAATEMRRADRDGAGISLVCFDLDGLKAVNDEHGHEAGDLLIIKFVEVVQATSRPTDLVARLGGDEFAMLLPGLDPTAALAVVERLGRELTARGYSASAGIVAVDPTDTDFDVSLHRADAAMYEAKRERAGTVIWTA